MKINKNKPLPPRILLYGTRGIGKTTFAKGFPKPVYLPCENGLASVGAVDTFPQPETIADVLAALEEFKKSEFVTLVIDTIDALETLIHKELCKKAGCESILDNNKNSPFSWGRGYSLARREYQNIQTKLDELQHLGKIVLILGHSTQEKIEPPDVEPYTRYALKLHKTLAEYIYDQVDCCLFANYKVVVTENASSGTKRGVGSGERILYTEERPSHIAKNRYELPFKCPLDAAKLLEAIKLHNNKA